MILKIYGKSKQQIINVNREFFSDSVSHVGRSSVTVTPIDKATQLGRDIFGKNYEGHILEQDGVVISNTLENRKTKNPVRQGHATKIGKPELQAASRVRTFKF